MTVVCTVRGAGFGGAGGASSGEAVTVTVTTGVGSSSHGAAGSVPHPGTSSGVSATSTVAGSEIGAVSGAAARSTAPLSPRDMATADKAAVRRDRANRALREFPSLKTAKEILVGQK
ncbi:hypothetical protein GCM10018953_20170 [Streptosporangium nondiastaticum]